MSWADYIKMNPLVKGFSIDIRYQISDISSGIEKSEEKMCTDYVFQALGSWNFVIHVIYTISSLIVQKILYLYLGSTMIRMPLPISVPISGKVSRNSTDFSIRESTSSA